VAQHHVSWLSPARVRRFFLAGSDGSATFDDMQEDAKLVLCDRGEDNRIGSGAGEAKELFYRPGEVRTPALRPVQPLANECARFLESIRTGTSPPADGRAGLSVVRVLAAAERSIADGGRSVALAAS
jgi:predicted dehydrogenase